MADVRRRRMRMWVLAFVLGPLVAVLLGMMIPIERGAGRNVPGWRFDSPR